LLWQRPTLRQRRTIRSTCLNDAKQPSFVRSRRTQISHDLSAFKSWLINSRRFSEDSQRNITTNTTSVIRLSTLVEALKSVTLHYTSLRTLLKEYMLNCDLRLGQPYDHVNQRRHFTLRLVLMNMLMSTNIASIGLIERTEDADKAEDKAHTEEIVQGIHTAEEDTREVIKKIEHFDRRSATSVISQAAGQRSIPPRNARKLIRSSVNKRCTQQSKMLLPSSTAASLPSTKDLKELTILLLPLSPRPSSSC
jgi:hypothetical protein